MRVPLSTRIDPSRGTRPVLSSPTDSSISPLSSMPPSPSGGDSAEFWTAVDADELGLGDIVCLDALMPTGFTIAINCATDRTLADVKAELFQDARSYPLYELLLPPCDYIFVTVGPNGEIEELYDESRSVFSLRLCIPLLKLVEPEGNHDEKQLAHDIGLIIGCPLTELERHLTEDLHELRADLYHTMETAVQTRMTSDGRDFYTFPEDMLTNVSDCDLTQRNEIAISLLYATNQSEPREAYQSMTIRVDVHSTTPHLLLKQALLARSRKTPEKNVSDEALNRAAREYILQVMGARLYLDQPVALINFKYIRSCVEAARMPQLMLLGRDALLTVVKDYGEPQSLIQPGWLRVHRAAGALPSPDARSLWQLADLLRIRVHSASHITVTDVDAIYVKVAIYHGPMMLFNRDSRRVSPSNPRWSDVWIDYDLCLKDIPQSAQICLSLISVKTRKNKEEHLALGWANLRLMDWRDELLQGKQSVYLWQFPRDYVDTVYPIGQIGSNPNHEMIRLEIELPDHNGPVRFPDMDSANGIKAYVANLDQWSVMRPRERDALIPPVPVEQFLDKVLARIDAQLLTDEEQVYLWNVREEVLSRRPEGLPLLLDCVIWSERESVARLYCLLDRWPIVGPETALQLLDIKYPDRRVRAFAVRCIDRQLFDDQLELYLMSLVQVGHLSTALAVSIQALKYEPWGSCELARMLLRRALRHQRIGHVLFWLIRAEIAQFSLATGIDSHTFLRFALILEALCRGAVRHLQSLMKQIDVVNILAKLSEEMKRQPKDGASKKLRSELSACAEMLSAVQSPLDPTNILASLRLDECRVISSAKMPLRLCWDNPDVPIEHARASYEILFKNGDDLRQDMLTLQVLRIMDAIWKTEQYDFCLNAYACLPMGKNIGMIQVVRNCSTIYEIQCANWKNAERKTKAGAAFNIGPQFLNKWIRSHNHDPTQYLEAVDRFTRSCAGYCVATFVLGIKDRHQDNIMVTEDGRLFHIDFGHFLGHYKKKLGINRDRVPFVLTDHFIAVIAKGNANFRESHEFKKFQELCGKAYMLLHKHAKLFISLFTMMLCMGIPELERLEDVNFLRRTLAADMSDQEALAYFQHQLNEAYEGGWTTKTNWFFHSVRHL